MIKWFVRCGPAYFQHFINFTSAWFRPERRVEQNVRLPLVRFNNRSEPVLSSFPAPAPRGRAIANWSRSICWRWRFFCSFVRSFRSISFLSFASNDIIVQFRFRLHRNLCKAKIHYAFDFILLMNNEWVIPACAQWASATHICTRRRWWWHGESDSLPQFFFISLSFRTWFDHSSELHSTPCDNTSADVQSLF